MRRREFVTLLGGTATAWSLAARAQAPGKLPTIGYLGDDPPSWGPWTTRFVERLRELGWREGHTIAIEYRWSEGRPERVAEIAAAFVRQNVDVIVTYGGAVATLKQVAAAIPIVFAIAVDPVGSGIVASLSHPGGNVTGLSVEQSDIAGKRLQLLREVVPASADWRSCTMPGIPQPCGRMTRLRPRLARLALVLRHTGFDERRILHRPSRLLSPKPMQFTSRSTPSLTRTARKSRR